MKYVIIDFAFNQLWWIYFSFIYTTQSKANINIVTLVKKCGIDALVISTYNCGGQILNCFPFHINKLGTHYHLNYLATI